MLSLPLTLACRTENQDGLASCVPQKYREELFIKSIGERPIISGGLDAISFTLKRYRPVFLSELLSSLVYD